MSYWFPLSCYHFFRQKVNNNNNNNDDDNSNFKVYCNCDPVVSTETSAFSERD